MIMDTCNTKQEVRRSLEVWLQWVVCYLNNLAVPVDDCQVGTLINSHGGVKQAVSGKIRRHRYHNPCNSSAQLS